MSMRHGPANAWKTDLERTACVERSSYGAGAMPTLRPALALTLLLLAAAPPARASLSERPGSGNVYLCERQNDRPQLMRMSLAIVLAVKHP
jgi:hypothetical protein